jgi:hypothetical protein
VASLRNFDLAPDGKRVVALMPAAEAEGSQEAQNHVVFLLRRAAPQSTRGESVTRR